MKKKRTIVLKNPKLRKLRDSLRYILSEALINETGKLIRKESKLNLDQNKDQIKKLSNKIDLLDTSWKRSICVCPVCGSRTSDMTFNPYDKYWYCTKCYIENQVFFIKRNEAYRYP